MLITGRAQRVASPATSSWLGALVLGFAGSLTIAITARSVGAQPRHLPTYLQALRSGDWTVYFVGLAVLVAAFALLGRTLLRHGTVTVRQMQLCALAWALPLIFAGPIGSTDLWSYVGQANVYAHGADPYRYGPNHVPGPYADLTPRRWRGQPAPYGPAFLLLARAAVRVSGDDVHTAVLVMKAVASLAFVGLVLLLPALCRRYGTDPVTGTWLAAANPLVVVVGLGGGHNDLVMASVAALGMWVAARPGPALRTLVPAAVLLAIAMEVKAPAAIMLAFLPYVWLARRGVAWSWRPFLAACAVVVACAGIVVALTSVATGLGLGWTRSLGAADTGIVWLSVPIVLVLIDAWIHGNTHITFGTSASYAGGLAATVASALAVVLLVPLWLTTMRGDALRRLTLALLVSILLSTSVQPWYLCWLLVVLAVAKVPRWLVVAAAAISLGLTACVGPTGNTTLEQVVGAGTLLVVGALTGALLALPRRNDSMLATSGRTQPPG